MKKVFLKQLKLINFKGIRELTIEFNDRTNIHGRNRAGKSTVADSFFWLLWGKDQFDRKDYEIKTLDENNEPIHKLSHEVEGLFLVDGIEERPKRIYKEIWTRKRGEEKPTFTGHETLYFWNDVPMKMADYQAKVNGIISEGMFKLITNPLYFNTLPWDKKRACLLDIAGGITDNEIFGKIASPGNDYSKLIKTINSGKTAAEYKKEIGAKKLKIKNELADIPARIDEAERSKPESFDFPALELLIKEKESEIANIEASLGSAVTAQAESQRVLMHKQSKVHSIKTHISQIKYGIQTRVEAEQYGVGAKVSQAESEIKNINQNIGINQESLKFKRNIKQSYERKIAELNPRLEQLRDEYDVIDAEEFKFDDTACVCPTCKQMLQEHDIEVKKLEMNGNFNNNKLGRINKLVSEATTIKEQIAETEKSLLSIDTQIDGLNKEINRLQGQLPSLNEKLDTARLVENNMAAFNLIKEVNDKLALDPEAIELNRQIEALESEITEESVTPAGGDILKTKRQELRQELDGLRNKYSNKSTLDRINKRIAELKSQEETLSQELAGFELTEFQILNYEKAKMDILENRINSKFQLVSFKMFNRQINGGEEPCCECLFQGVPYGSLNTEAKINCGLDIINVLCDHYGVYAPVFIDNRESVTDIIPTRSQVISLIVNPECETLNVQAA